MSKLIHFTKMHGLGNDYIYVDSLRYPIGNPEQCAQVWSMSHTGIGSDGLVLIGRSEVADFSMRIFNADGSEAMMCGNASRCIGKYVHDNRLTDKKEITLETQSGIKRLLLHITDSEVKTVTVDMGTPSFNNSEQVATADGCLHNTLFQVNGNCYNGTFVCMGNPHLVLFVDNVDNIPLEETGPLLECHALFPQRTNVEFAEVKNNNCIRMRVWERGSGITQACGTGACATAVAAIATQRVTSNKINIEMDGGNLQIEWNGAERPVMMTGPAVTVFEGEILQPDNK